MQNNKWYIIANPTAGKGRVNRKLPSIEKLLHSNGIKYELVLTRKKGDCIDLAKKGIQKGFRYLLAIGGDGTNNEVINGIMQQTIVPSQNITYSILSIGTGNDWIKTHGIPQNVEKFVSIIKRGNTTFQDVGVVTFLKNNNPQKRFFANVAGMAYDAFVVKKTENQSALFSNKLFYLISLLRYLFQYKLQRAKIQLNGIELTDYFYTINIGICRFAGGGMEIIPHAVPNDGQLAITIAGRFSKWSVLLNTYRFYNGTIAELSKITTHFSTNVKVNSLEKYPILLEVDGEFIGSTPVEFGIVSKALKIVIP